MNTLSALVNDTVEISNRVFDTEDVYLIHPYIVLSIEDTTFFVFAGRSVDGGDEEWE